jgi:pyruvate/2-oxoglutarate/acetoin dehydrogenase E1 component
MFADFAGVAFDQLANQLAKYRYMTGGQVGLPVTIRLANGAGGGFGAQHSQAAENWFLNVVGLKLVVPATAADAYGLMRAAIEDDDPVLFFEHKNLLGRKEEVPGDLQSVRLGSAAVVRDGADVTVVASQQMRHRAAEAAEQLEGDGISVDLIDPRTLIPFVVVQESPSAGSWGANLISVVARDRFESLDAPPALIGGDETPIPYAGSLEEAWLPSPERIADGIRSTHAY